MKKAEERAMSMQRVERVVMMAMMSAAALMMMTVPVRAQDVLVASGSQELQAQMMAIHAEMLARGAQIRADSMAMRAPMLAQAAIMQAEMMTVGDPQVKDDLFAGTEKFATGASDVTDVNLGPDMLGMVNGKHGGDLAHKMNFMVVRTYEYPHAGMYRMEDVEAYRQKLRTGNWNCFVHTYESKSGESTDICGRALANGQGNEMVILTVEPKELTFVHISGKGSLADLGKLGKLGGNGPEPPTPPTPPHP